MNKKYLVFILIIIAILGFYFGISFKNKTKINNDVPYEKVENYVELSEIPTYYTIQEAIADGYVTIETNGNLNNQDKLDLFLDNVKNGVSDTIRIVEEYGEEKVAITDALFDGEMLSISYDYSRSSESGDGIITNNYLISEYDLVKEAETLKGGNSVMLYKIVNKEKSEDVYYLTGYVVYGEQ